MSPFNPSISPTQDPNYLNYSKTISTIPADTSTADFIKGASTFFGDAVEVADSSIKRGIDKDVYAKVDPLRDTYTDILKGKGEVSQDSGLMVNPNNAPAGSIESQGAVSIFAPTSLDPKNVPPGIANGLSGAASVQGAMEHGKLSQTAYEGQLAVIAKDLRTQWPGYRDYIDKKISEVTGGNPANKYISGLIEDLNKAATNANEEKNHFRNILTSAEALKTPGVENILGAYMANPTTANGIAAVGWLSRQNAFKFHKEQMEAQNAERLITNDVNKEQVKGQMAVISGQRYSEFGDNFLTNYKMTSGETIMEAVTKHLTGERLMDDTQAQGLGQMLAMKNTEIASRIKAEFQKQIPGTQTTYEQMAGGSDEVDKIIGSASNKFSSIVKSFNDKDVGMAFTKMHLNQAYQEDVTNKVLNGTNASFLMKLKVIQDKGGPAAAAHVFISAYGTDVPNMIKDFVAETNTDMRVPRDLRSSAVATFNNAVSDAKAKFGQEPKTIGTFIGNLRELSNPDPKLDADKVNLIDWFYGGGNNGVINKFQKDAVVNGRRVEGKLSVLTNLVTSEISNSVKSLDERHPGVFQTYKNFAQKEGGAAIAEELANINKMEAIPGVRIMYVKGTGFVAESQQGAKKPEIYNYAAPFSPDNTTPLPLINGYLSNINVVIRALSNVSKAEGTDVNAYVVDRMAKSGIDFTQGIPKQMLDAIKLANMPPPPGAKGKDQGQVINP